jgi:hypothetical protein
VSGLRSKATAEVARRSMAHRRGYAAQWRIKGKTAQRVWRGSALGEPISGAGHDR